VGGRQLDDESDWAGVRCLLVTSSLDAGGMDEVVAFLAYQLPCYGISVAVLQASGDGAPNGTPTGRLGRQLLAHGIETVELTEAAAEPWVQAWHPDVISIHGAPSWVLEIATRLSIPSVETLHGMHSLFSADRFAVAEYGRKLSGIIAVSNLVRQQYLQLNPAFPQSQILTIPNSVDRSRRILGDRRRAREKWQVQQEYVFVSLARYCLQKNTYGLIAAFSELAGQYPEAHLVIAGRVDDTSYFDQIVRLRSRLPCRDRIHLRDHSPNPADLLSLADGFVLNSFFEGWSLASMEALYAGLPVVLSEVGGAREQIGTGNGRGYVVPNPAGDPLKADWNTIRDIRYSRQINRNDFVSAMGSLVSNRAYWLDAREKLIVDSAQRFHPDLCVRRHLRVLSAAALNRAFPSQEYLDENATVVQ
jgi:glycosyltransferase involved in cell wall biosynthesis